MAVANHFEEKFLDIGATSTEAALLSAVLLFIGRSPDDVFDLKIS